MSGHTAVLVVHGIGAQKRGQTLDKLVRGLRLADREFDPRPEGNGLAGTLGGQPVRLYEVYWADLLMGEATSGAFQMNELQGLSWFPWFNFRRGSHLAGSYSLLKVAWWCIALPIFNFFLLFAYHGARVVIPLLLSVMEKDIWPKGPGWLSRLRQRVLQRGGATPALVDHFLDEYAGDVFTYVNSAGRAFYRERNEPPVPAEAHAAFAAILRRFHEQLIAAAAAEDCTTIQIVAHSLGTVVTYHALSGFEEAETVGGDAETVRKAIAKVSRVYTIGSPLEKIRFFWPRIAPVDLPASMAQFRWDNFASFFDPVSGILKTYDNWGEVKNHRLLGGGFILGHLLYEHSAVFLDVLTEGLAGSQLRVQRPITTRLRDAVVLIGETVAAPIGMALIVLAGALVFGVCAALLPWAVSWVVRWFVAEATWRPIVDKATLVILGMMVLTFLVAPAGRASKVHRLHWTRTGGPNGSEQEAA